MVVCMPRQQQQQQQQQHSGTTDMGLLLPSYGLKSSESDHKVVADAEPVFGLPFKFGRPLTFKRDLQVEQQFDVHNAQDRSRLRRSKRVLAEAAQQRPAYPQAARTKHQQQHIQCRELGPSNQQPYKACTAAGQVPLGFLAASLAQLQGVSTAAAAEALAAVAVAAAAFTQAAELPAGLESGALSSSAGPSTGDDQPVSCAQPAAGAAHNLRVDKDADEGRVRHTGEEIANRAACTQAVSLGPGQYSLPAAIGQGPAFTMGARTVPQQSDARAAANVPGPGAYSSSSARGPSGPAFSIGGRWRELGQEAGAPGPGQHQQLDFIPAGPAFSIPRRPDDGAGRRGSSSPGPGAYGQDWDTPASPSGPAWSLGMRPRGMQTGSSAAAGPGPGAYHPDTTAYVPDGPAYSFPASTVADMSSRAAAAGPAPGDYNPSAADSHTAPCAPAYSIPKATAASGRAAVASLSAGPGPGYYFDPSTDPAAIGRGAPAFTIGCRQQEATEGGGLTSQSPGPGEYFRDAGVGGGPAFSMAGRPSNVPAAGHASSTPGPGHYSASAAAGAGSTAAPAWTIAGRVASAAAATAAAVPGPGSYHVTGQGEPRGPAYSIQGKAKAAADAQPTPGPLDYCPDPTPLLPSAPCYSISGRGGAAATRRAAEDNSPGPAEYEQEPQQAGVLRRPAWTIAGRAAAAAVDTGSDSPGPGFYHRPMPAGVEGPAFTIAARLPAAPTADGAGLLPGPGQYEVARTCGESGAAFTIAGRLKTIAEQQEPTPGPGAYLTADFVDPGGSSAPAFTISSRTGGLGQGAAVPGPGAYPPAELPRGPAYSLAGRHAGQEQHGKDGAGPGPGAYDATAPGGVSAPAWSMGAKVAAAGEAGAADTPAPGDYHPLPELPRGPAWTLAAKTAAPGALTAAAGSAADLPGPGHYSLPDQQERGPAYSIAGKGSRLAMCAAGDEEPGPGAYFVDKGPKGRAYTFGSKLATAGPASSAAASGQDDTPGPGYYHRDSSVAPAAAGTAANLVGKATARSAALAGSASSEVSQQSVRRAQLGEAPQPVPQPTGTHAPALADKVPPSRRESQSGSGTKAMTLAQLNAQLAALLKHKGPKQQRMQRYCSSVAA